jgi:hypothetical protein
VREKVPHPHPAAATRLRREHQHGRERLQELAQGQAASEDSIQEWEFLQLTLAN